MKKVRTRASRVWSMLLVVAMLLTMLPTVAFAAESPQTIYVNASNQGTAPDGSENNPYTEIAAAVEAADDGDTIKVVAVEGYEYEPFELANLENLTIEGISDTYGNKPVIKTNYAESPVTVYQGCGAVVPGLGMDGLRLIGLEFKNYGYSDAWYSSSIALNGNTGANVSGAVIDSCDFTVAENAPHKPNYAAFLNTDTFTFTNNKVVGYNNGVVCMADGSTLNTVTITGNTFNVTTNALYLYNGKYDSNAPGTIIFTDNTMLSGQIELWDYANSRVGQEDGGSSSIKTVITDVDTSEVPIITTAIDQGDTSFKTEDGNAINNVVFNYEDAKQALENTSNGDSFYIGYSADKGEGNTLYTKTAIDEYEDENGTVYNSWAAKLSSTNRTYDTIEDAVAKANDGDTLTISAGTHTITNAPLTISKRINLVGAGADKTTIAGAVQYKFSESQEGSTLTVSGITFQAGSGDKVQGLQFCGDKPNDGYNVNIAVTNCAFDGWNFGITMNSHANGYNMAVTGCTFTDCLYAVSYNYDVTTTGQQANNSLTFGGGNIISDGCFAVQKFNNVNTGESVEDNTYATIEDFESDAPTISGRVVYVTSELATAVSDAADGSTLIVAPGTYDGNITFGGKSLTIKAQYPAYMNGEKEADESKLSKFTGTFNTSEGTNDTDFNAGQKVVIDGFALFGDGLKIGNNNYNTVGNLEVRHCTMAFGSNLEESNNYNQPNYFVKTSGNSGEPYASVTVEENYISGTPVANVYPIQLWDVKSVVVRDNVLELTNASNHQAISVSKMAKDATVEISDNVVNGAGGGIYVTTWQLGGEITDAEATFTGSIAVNDNTLNNVTSETMEPIFIGYEEAAAENGNPYGLMGGTISAMGNTDGDGTSVKAEIVYGPAESENAPALITATFMDGNVVVGTISGTSASGTGPITITMPAALPDRSNYAFGGWSANGTTYEVGQEVSISEETTFTAVWNYTGSTSSGGGGSVTTYAITVEESENGQVEASRTSASRGSSVTLTVTPDEGYELSSLTVTDADGNEIEVTENDGIYRFTMPSSKVTVTAEFAESSETPGTPEEPGTTGLPFTDVASTDWYYDAVAYAYENDLMNGISSTQFNPNGTTTRGMIATILYRLEGEPEAPACDFTDVAAGQYYTDAVAWAAENHLVNGYGDGTFGPNDNITREQMSALLYRYAEFKGYDLTARGDLSGYTDASQISDYAVTAMQWATAEGLVNGMGDGTLAPRGNSTRAQIATILMRFLENIA